VIVYKKGSMREYHIKLFKNHQEVEVTVNDSPLITFKDEFNHESDFSSFTRYIGKHEYIYRDGKRVFLKIEKKTPFLKEIKKSSHQYKKIITMDLETRIINGKMTAYCVSIFDGKDFKSFYLSDFNCSKTMIR
jgi:ribosomal protein S19